MEDHEIVGLYLSRNEQAISASRSKYGAFLYGIAMNILRQPEDAEECESDTYYSAWRHIPPDEPWALRSYLGKITRYLSISRYRMRHAAKRDCNMERMLDELEQCIPDSNDPQQELEAREAGKYIGAWLETQRKENRLLFIRRYWYGDTLEDLSSAFEMPKARISQRLSRLRGRLKVYLEQQGVFL